MQPWQEKNAVSVQQNTKLVLQLPNDAYDRPFLNLSSFLAEIGYKNSSVLVFGVYADWQNHTPTAPLYLAYMGGIYHNIFISLDLYDDLYSEG